MGIPLIQAYCQGWRRYIAGRKLRGEKRYPLVLMLEPLFQCNLACAGCGKIDYPKEILQKRVSVEDALRAVDECGAPMVSIPGGEPLIHKEMPQIVAGIVARKKFVYLCTNAILLAKHIDEYQPSPYLTFSIHLDGNRERHDESVCQEGVFDKAVAAIKLARSKGFRVTINCTLFNGEDPDDVAEFFDTAMALGVEGITVSPGLQLSPRAAAGCVPRAQRQQAAVPRDLQARAARPSGKRAGRSIIRRCSWISSPATRPISARRGATRPTTSSAGSGPATCCPTRAMRRLTVPHRGHRVGAATASAATRAATTAWRTAASRARRSTTRSAIRSRR